MLVTVAPAAGSTDGGTRVTLTGSGFATAPGATVIDFGRFAASRVRCRSHTVCTVRTPAHLRGRVRVAVSVNGLSAAPRATDQFNYAPA